MLASAGYDGVVRVYGTDPNPNPIPNPIPNPDPNPNPNPNPTLALTLTRDLKPENVLLLDRRGGLLDLRIGDFGLARRLDGPNGTTVRVRVRVRVRGRGRGRVRDDGTPRL